MNTELLERIAAHIEAHPEHFKMQDWCGTACCIAGHACALSGVAATERTVDTLAKELLGIDAMQADRLFLAPPRKFYAAMWHGREPSVRANAAAACIRYFIQTEGRE